MMKSTSLLTFACLMLPFLASSSASFSDCRPKYSGNIAINNNQVGINGEFAFLGKVAQGFTPVNFVFYECKIAGYSRSPDEYGFIIANGVDKSKCATALPHNDENSWATIDHHECDYNGANKEQINRQLVYANYYRPGGGDAVIDITFQGSPKTETNTGFTLRHASFYDQQTKGIKEGSVIIDNKTYNLGYDTLALHDVVILPSDSMVPGQPTTNEQKIKNDLGKNGFTPSASAQAAYSSSKKIF
ncbi:uncharacterized protein FA14DRAFT_193016 [Meira miltonrushii]|uniref:Uncharacterized protein n=1 Tax=Meira miltonrushii TaxID=1280837 RepID=A0A316V1I8_9BASI|nr:uncharacterized protein FA14DRAFT_193016 [Meira miltonrushii]PWN31417.1 hypothetical protein FA14DRAFT_193016 [Meira miltonrushii]